MARDEEARAAPGAPEPTQRFDVWGSSLLALVWAGVTVFAVVSLLQGNAGDGQHPSSWWFTPVAILGPILTVLALRSPRRIELEPDGTLRFVSFLGTRAVDVRRVEAVVVPRLGSYLRVEAVPRSVTLVRPLDREKLLLVALVRANPALRIERPLLPRP